MRTSQAQATGLPPMGPPTMEGEELVWHEVQSLALTPTDMAFLSSLTSSSGGDISTP